MANAKLQFVATIHGANPRRVMVVGRPAWFLLVLLKAGTKGTTTLERPAPRISHYLFVLRKLGFSVSTEYEAHSGPFGGTHGRFTLLDRVTVEGGTLAEYLASPEGYREFAGFDFARVAA